MKKKNTCSRLRHRLTLQQESRTADGAGGYVRSWQNVADLWAEIITVTTVSGTGIGKEVVVAGQIQAEITHRILLRYRTGVTAGMRLLFESRAFNIRYVADSNEDGDTVELLVQEGVAT